MGGRAAGVDRSATACPADTGLLSWLVDDRVRPSEWMTGVVRTGLPDPTARVLPRSPLSPVRKVHRPNGRTTLRLHDVARGAIDLLPLAGTGSKPGSAVGDVPPGGAPARHHAEEESVNSPHLDVSPHCRKRQADEIGRWEHPCRRPNGDAMSSVARVPEIAAVAGVRVGPPTCEWPPGVTGRICAAVSSAGSATATGSPHPGLWVSSSLVLPSPCSSPPSASARRGRPPPCDSCYSRRSWSSRPVPRTRWSGALCPRRRTPR